MAHIDEPPPSYEAVLEKLRPGDVLTHAFRPFPNAPVTHQGKLKPEVIEARARGVQFDIGHGMGSFAFKTARAMLANGFHPDTISSDIHALNVDGPVFDQVTTLSKFLCLGMTLPEVIRASTVNAATALKRPELGSLKPGSIGDATVISRAGGRVRLCRRRRRGDARQPEDRFRGRRHRRPLVASAVNLARRRKPSPATPRWSAASAGNVLAIALGAYGSAEPWVDQCLAFGRLRDHVQAVELGRTQPVHRPVGRCGHDRDQ